MLPPRKPLKATVLKNAKEDWGEKTNSALLFATSNNDLPPNIALLPVVSFCLCNSLSAPRISSSVFIRATRREAFTVYNPKASDTYVLLFSGVTYPGIPLRLLVWERKLLFFIALL